MPSGNLGYRDLRSLNHATHDRAHRICHFRMARHGEPHAQARSDLGIVDERGCPDGNEGSVGAETDLEQRRVARRFSLSRMMRSVNRCGELAGAGGGEKIVAVETRLDDLFRDRRDHGIQTLPGRVFDIIRHSSCRARRAGASA